MNKYVLSIITAVLISSPCMAQERSHSGSATVNIALELVYASDHDEVGQDYLNDLGYEHDYWRWKEQCCRALNMPVRSQRHYICQALDEGGFLKRCF